MTAATLDTNHQDFEYEYQYDDYETESFLINLDLSSVNRVIKSRLRKGGPKRRGAKNGAPTKSTNNDAFDEVDSTDEASPGQDKARVVTSDAPTPGEKARRPENSIQILGIDSGNPIMSYQGQLYSCSWTDMIGTNMFFTQPIANQGEPSLQSTPDFNLIGTSRIKLVGQKANLVPKSSNRKRERSADDEEEAIEGVAGGAVDARSFPGFRSTNWRSNIERRKQANFLDRLMQVKRARGENDIVTTLSDRKTDTIYRSNTAHLSAEEKLRIQNLSNRVVKGDARAVASLKEIYSRLGTGASKPDPPLEDAIEVPTPTPVTIDQQLDDHG